MAKKAKKVKVYDPGRSAYYDLDIEEAKKYQATLKELDKAIKKAEAEELDTVIKKAGVKG